MTPGGIAAEVQVFLLRESEDRLKVAVVVELTNPNDAPAWEPNEARIEPARDERAEQGVAVFWAPLWKPVAIRALPRVIPRARTAGSRVFDRTSAGLDEMDGAAMVLQILREGRPQFAVELTPADVRDSRSAFERWWSR